MRRQKAGYLAKKIELFVIPAFIFLIVFGTTLAFHYNEYPAWDAAAYLVNGEFFFGKVYLYDDQRPPLLPLFWGAVSTLIQDLWVLSLIDVTIRVIVCVMVYFFSRKYLSKSSSFFLSLLLGISIIPLRMPLFFSEFFALAFLILSLHQLILIDTKKTASFKTYFLLFFFASLAILTRYPVLAYYFVVAFVLLDNWKWVRCTWRELASGFLLGSIPIFFWMWWNWKTLGNPIFSFVRLFTAVSSDLFSLPWHYYFWSSPENIFAMLSISLLLLAYGTYHAWNNRMKIFATFPFIFLILQTCISGKLARYLFFFLFFSYFLIFYGTEKLLSQNKNNKLKVFTIFLVFVILLLPAVYTNPSNENWKGKEFHTHGLILREITAENATLLSKYSPQIAYASHRRTYTLISDICATAICPDYPVGMKIMYGCAKIDYVVLDEPAEANCIEEYYIDERNSLYVYSYKK